MVVISLIRLWMGQVFCHIWMLVKCRTSHSRHMYPSRICRKDVVHGQESPSIVRRKDAPSQKIQSILDELKEAFAGFFVFVVFGSDFFSLCSLELSQLAGVIPRQQARRWREEYHARWWVSSWRSDFWRSARSAFGCRGRRDVQTERREHFPS